MALSGRVALVTGASSGIGRALALRLVEAGARVVVTARRHKQLEQLVSEITDLGGEGLAVQADVEDEASLKAAFDAGEHRFGLIDTVYANAGMNIDGLAVDIAMADFDRILRINTRGVFLTAREAARRLIAAGPERASAGRIVLVSSIGGVSKVIPGSAAYCVSKAGVVMMGKSLAREWARYGINVNVFCPGFIRTELTSETLEDERGRTMVERFPRRRVMQPGDLDDLFLFLGSDAARAVTGSVFVVDDGQSL